MYINVVGAQRSSFWNILLTFFHGYKKVSLRVNHSLLALISFHSASIGRSTNSLFQDAAGWLFRFFKSILFYEINHSSYSVFHLYKQNYPLTCTHLSDPNLLVTGSLPALELEEEGLNQNNSEKKKPQEVLK